jgi:peptidoglycan hydrolase CwlO-like protein
MSNDNTTTKPTIETVLERVNALGDQLNNKLTELQTGQVQLQNEVAELRTGQVEMRNDIAELISAQRKVRLRFEALNDTLLSIQVDMRDDRRDFDRRLEKLESPSS